jgi:hypothetical protein
LWEMTSASVGSSRRLGIKHCDQRIWETNPNYIGAD